MLRLPPYFRLSHLWVIALVALGGFACQSRTVLQSPPTANNPQRSAISPPNPQFPDPVAIPSPTTVPQINTFDLGLDKAASADSITKTAQSEEDWNLVADQWLQAIDLMKRVPPTHPNQALAKQKVAEYERQLIFAKRQAQRFSGAPGPEAPTNLSTFNAASPRPVQSVGQPGVAYRARITRRVSNTPVIEVTFNGQHRFEMVVDTGASATVITQQMASILGVVPTDTVTVDTASARNVQIPVGVAPSLEAGGLVSQNVMVMIAGPELDIGLLGHNFYGNYDITIRQDVVEFSPR